MSPEEFLNQLDEPRVVQAIAAAELRTSGEIRVFVSRRAVQKETDVMTRARKRFVQLGLAATRERNGVLIYFHPRAREFAILGDEGIAQRCGPEFWNAIAAQIGRQLKLGKFTDAVVQAVEKVGEALSHHFPRGDDDVNELPDDVVTD